MRQLQSILFATEFRPACDAAVLVTACLAKQFGSQVSVLGVREGFSDESPVHPMLREVCDKLLTGVLEQFAAQDVTVCRSLLKTGSIAHTITCVATEINTDLIVLEAGKLSSKHDFVAGAVTQAVMEHAIQPVLLVHPTAPATMFKTILCPVDQSDVSHRGLRNAIQLAKSFDARLIVLSVVPSVSWLTAAEETRELTDVQAKYAFQWCNELEDFLDEIDFAGVRHSKEIRFGIPHDEIVAVAKEQQADLLIMGATGRTGLVQVLLGSTTRRVFRELPCSLLLVKQEDVGRDLSAETNPSTIPAISEL